MNYIKGPATNIDSPSGAQVVTTTAAAGSKVALDVNVVSGGGGGGGGGDVILKDDSAQRLSLVDVSGVKKVPVVADVILTPNDDGVHIGSKTTGNRLEPNADGSIPVTSPAMLDVLTQLQGMTEVLESLATAMLRYQPQLDVTNKPMVRINAIDTGLTLSNVTTLNTFAGGNTAGIPYHLSSPPNYIYQFITIS